MLKFVHDYKATPHSHPPPLLRWCIRKSYIGSVQNLPVNMA